MAAMADQRDLRLAYDARATRTSGPAVSLVERALLCDLFDELGPAAPTLSGKWDTHHLAAHLVARERDPLSSLKAAIPKYGDAAVETLVVESAFPELVERVRSGPPTLSIFGSRSTDKNFNTLEFFIHHEDVRRAQPSWSRRVLPVWAENQVWSRIRIFAKAIMRHSRVPVSLARADTDDVSVASKGDEPAVVRGLPTELALFVYGRPDVADVSFDGPQAAVRRLTKQHFGL